MSDEEFTYPHDEEAVEDDDDDEPFVYPGAAEEPEQQPPTTTTTTTTNDSFAHIPSGTPSAAQLESVNAACTSGDLALLKKLFTNATETSQVERFSLANEASSRTGSTALHAAASKGHMDIVEWLIEECGALPNLEDREGETALHKAALNGHLGILQYLLPNRADVNTKDSDGWTALHNAASKGYLDIVRFLCEVGGANEVVDGTAARGVDLKSKSGWTALMNAASKGHLPIVRYLLTKQRANPLIRNNWGETAYDVSAAVFEIYICDLLQASEMAMFAASGQTQVYDPLAVHTTIPCVLYENQRLDTRLKTVAMNGGKPKFTASGLRTTTGMAQGQAQGSRHAFELRVPGTDGKVVGAWRSDVQLPFIDDPFRLPQPGKNGVAQGRERSCFWLSDWTLDTTHPSYDPITGWAYSQSFNPPESEWTPTPPSSHESSSSSSTPQPQKIVRRRRWVRLLRRRLDIPPLPFLQPDGKFYMLGNDGELVPPDEIVSPSVGRGDLQGEDYVSAARRLVGSGDVNGQGQSPEDPGEVRRSVLKLQRATESLRMGILVDTDAERKTQAEVLLNAYSRELDRRKEEARSRGIEIISGNDDELFDHVEATSDDEEEEFHYPGAGPSSPSPWSSPRPASRQGSVISSDYFARPLSRNTTTSSFPRLAADLTPQLSHAPEFRVPTHEAPPSQSQSNSSDLGRGGLRRRAEWEKDENIQNCRGCLRKFTFLLRRHHCRRCGKIFCDKCSSWRAVLDPEEIVHEPSANSSTDGESTPTGYGLRTMNSRVCEGCFIDVSGGRDDGSNARSGSRNGSFDFGLGRGMLERIVIDRGRLYPRGQSLGMGRGRSSSQLSDLAECPVCNTNLEDVGSPAQQEAHVKNCLEGGNINGASSVQSAKYLVYTLPEESALIGVECVICLEEFVKGSSVARLSCFCSFHTILLNLPMVYLKPNSLYITTQQIFYNRGSFHWALVLTDDKSNVQRFEWMTLPRSGPLEAEAPVEGFIQRTYDANSIPEEIDSQAVLAFFQVKGFRRLPEDYDIGSWGNIFTSSPTIRENRLRGVTCRTWLLKVLEMLQSGGMITRNGSARDIEHIAKDGSIEAEDKLATGKFDIIMREI